MTEVGKRRIHTAAGPTLTSLALLTANAKILTSYAFDASAQTVEIMADDLVKPLLVINVTDGQVIYNPSVPTQKGSIVRNVLTLTYDTTLMEDDDELLIFYEAETIASLVDVKTISVLEKILIEMKLQTVIMIDKFDVDDELLEDMRNAD